MRKVILSMMVSIDGYIEGKNPTENWHHWDDEMAAYMMAFFNTVDIFIYGRKSYEDMLAYWPPLNDAFANVMNATPKLVFSRTVRAAEWNATVTREEPAMVINRLKKEAGKDMVLFAGADLAESFIKHNLINEYRLIVNPVVLGGGKPLFKNVAAPFGLRLADVVKFGGGNVLMIYKPLSC